MGRTVSGIGGRSSLSISSFRVGSRGLGSVGLSGFGTPKRTNPTGTRRTYGICWVNGGGLAAEGNLNFQGIVLPEPSFAVASEGRLPALPSRKTAAS